MPLVLNKRNVEEAHQLADNTYNDSFNCWGATLYAFDYLDFLEWIEVDEMEEFLEQNTFIIDENHIKEGDILALYSESGILQHTAVYLGGGVYWHKKGGMEAEYTDKQGVFEPYLDYYDYSEIRAIEQEINLK